MLERSKTVNNQASVRETHAMLQNPLVLMTTLPLLNHCDKNMTVVEEYNYSFSNTDLIDQRGILFIPGL